MHQVSFDPVEMKGKIITNTSLVEKERLSETLAVFYDIIQSGLSVSPLIMLGEEKRLIKIKTACSLTISGVLLKSGIPVRPKGGGLIEVVEREPTRFTDMLMYWATTIDPIDVLTSQELTDITGMMRTGNGRILGNLQEAPMLARDRIEEVLDHSDCGGVYRSPGAGRAEYECAGRLCGEGSRGNCSRGRHKSCGSRAGMWHQRKARVDQRPDRCRGDEAY